MRVYFYFILKDFKEGIYDKKFVKGEICDIWSFIVDFLYIFFKNIYLDEVFWVVLKNVVLEK